MFTFTATIYTGTCNKEIGTYSSNSIYGIKLVASRMCNKYNNMADKFVVNYDGMDIPFHRSNTKRPDGTMIRGKWH